MKKTSLLCFILCVVVFLCGCDSGKIQTATDREDPLRIVTTIFPPYDFAAAISGGKAEVTMLLKPGTESHSYEPSPQDMLMVQNCDIFIYNGGESDVWVDKLLSSMDTSTFRVLKMMDCVDVLREEVVEGMHHTHAHHEEHHHDHARADQYDEHIWTSPKNAITIVENIRDAMMEEDVAFASVYQENAAAYIKELSALDETFEEIVQKAARKEMIFADRFPFRYFAESYGLSYHAAFPGCSAEAEPGAKTVAHLIETIRTEEIPAVFYIEFSNQKVLDVVCEETGAMPLLFHSCHNLTPQELQKGLGYLSLMYENAENLKEALF